MTSSEKVRTGVSVPNTVHARVSWNIARQQARRAVTRAGMATSVRSSSQAVLTIMLPACSIGYDGPG
ncbi:hypothetical protein [uncultured Tateyamaria sp.]|uniref:hypothetical protein n=1 Tax=uncultured Tateyamaria sp. TaxID=455651 RepID=UPI00261BD02F|nr:hypothetical protein [uncultured Tateyamaria sp.]